MTSTSREPGSLESTIERPTGDSSILEREPFFNPIVTLRHANPGRNADVLFCIPGAGASVTSMVELSCALAGSWEIYGLQPRGIAPDEVPFASVEAAAQRNIQALLPMLAQRSANDSIHLLGHSYGGWVAFDMATRLKKQNIKIASLTLVDSEAPAVLDTDALDLPSIRREFMRAIKWTLGVDIHLPPSQLEEGSNRSFLGALHTRLVEAQQLPARSDPNLLQGPLSTFTAARNTRYIPEELYEEPMRLVQVCDPEVAPEDDWPRREQCAQAWRQWAPMMQVWQGTGHHFSVLKEPHVAALADWIFGRARTDC